MTMRTVMLWVGTVVMAFGIEEMVNALVSRGGWAQLREYVSAMCQMLVRQWRFADSSSVVLGALGFWTGVTILLLRLLVHK